MGGPGEKGGREGRWEVQEEREGGRMEGPGGKGVGSGRSTHLMM